MNPLAFGPRLPQHRAFYATLLTDTSLIPTILSRDLETPLAGRMIVRRDRGDSGFAFDPNGIFFPDRYARQEAGKAAPTDQINSTLRSAMAWKEEHKPEKE